MEVEITNPIELGAAFSNKDFILDIRVKLNNKQLIDLEMQILNEGNWPERSISYAARSFDNLERGDNYLNVMPVHSIGFLDFTLFPEAPEFYATYQLKNVKTGQIYSSKFAIHVVDLNRTDLATEEDQKYGIDKWAKLFKASTWEELRMITNNNPVLQQAAKDLYTINGDEILRQQARARADAEFWERRQKARIQQLENAIAERDNVLADKDNVIAEKDNVIAEKDNALAEKEKQIKVLMAQLEAQKNK